ncbi:MAG: hypothetical protein PSV35_05895 [bacterium]|nr:hypothetical protein [bacterium]
MKLGHTGAIYQLAQIYGREFSSPEDKIRSNMLYGRYYQETSDFEKAKTYYGGGLLQFRRSDIKLAAAYNALTELWDYGSDKENDKGELIKDFADELTIKLDDFIKDSFSKPITPVDEVKFLEKFNQLLHSKDKELGQHEKAWKPIITNIFIAISGVGLFALLCKASFHLVDVIRDKEQFSCKKMGFFAETTSQTLVNKVSDIVNEELGENKNILPKH